MLEQFSYKRIWGELFLYALLVAVLMPVYYFKWDMGCWLDWALYIHQHGIANVYHSNTNYPPVFLYMLYLYDLIQGSTSNIMANINNIKFFAFAFDLLPVILLIVSRQKRELQNHDHYLLLLNIAYIYNSVVWGQVDSIYSNLCLLSIFLALRNPYAAVVCFVVALNTKLQSIIFFPVLVIIISLRLTSFRKALYLALTGILTEIIVTMPFILGGTFKWYAAVLYYSVGFWSIVSANAFNFWHLVVSGDTRKIHDTTTWFIFSYKAIGFALFFLVSTVTLLPLTLKTIKIYIHKQLPHKYYELVFLTAGIIPLVFFFFNTEMHERYSHAAMIFLFFYALSSRKFGLYFLTSLAYFLNIEEVLRYLHIAAHKTLIFDSRFVALLFLTAICVGVYRIYRNYGVKGDALFIKDNWSLLFRKAQSPQ